jgi:hypothetical protein
MLTEIILGGLAFLVALFAWLLHGATNNRLKDKENELDYWVGVTDVKREIDNKLANDPDHAKRVRDKYNQTE